MDVILKIQIKSSTGVSIIFLLLLMTVLAFSVGDTKQVVLCDAEKAEILHLFPVDCSVSCMHWMEVQSDSKCVLSVIFLILSRFVNFFSFFYLKKNWFTLPFTCFKAPRHHPAIQRTSPVVSYQSYQRYPRGQFGDQGWTRSCVLCEGMLSELWRISFLKCFVFCVFSYSSSSKIFRWVGGMCWHHFSCLCKG